MTSVVYRGAYYCVHNFCEQAKLSLNHDILVLDDIYTRFTKRLCNRPQVPEGEAREPGRPGRRHRRQVRLPQPVGLDASPLALPVKHVRLHVEVGPGYAHHIRRVEHEPRGHGAGGVRGPHRRRADVGPGPRHHPHGEGGAGQPVPLELGHAVEANHGLEGPQRLHDVKLDVSYERPGVLDPLAACGPGELPGGPVSVTPLPGLASIICPRMAVCPCSSTWERLILTP